MPVPYEPRPTIRWAVPDGEFVFAGQLRPGQKVLVWKDSSLQPATVLKTTLEEREQPVYNLSVDWPNTFLAAGFLTHNKGGGVSEPVPVLLPGAAVETSPLFNFFLFSIFVLIFIIVLSSP